MERYLILGFLSFLGFITLLTSLATWGLSSFLDGHKEALIVEHIESDIAYLSKNTNKVKMTTPLTFYGDSDDASNLVGIQVNDRMDVETLSAIQFQVAKAAKSMAQSHLEKIKEVLPKKHGKVTKNTISDFLYTLTILNRSYNIHFTNREKQLLKRLKALKSSELNQSQIVRQIKKQLPTLDKMMSNLNQ